MSCQSLTTTFPSKSPPLCMPALLKCLSTALQSHTHPAQKCKMEWPLCQLPSHSNSLHMFVFCVIKSRRGSGIPLFCHCKLPTCFSSLNRVSKTQNTMKAKCWRNTFSQDAGNNYHAVYWSVAARHAAVCLNLKSYFGVCLPASWPEGWHWLFH